ncbi:Protein of unknown function [Lutibacter oricola]|uniref:DUF2851 domain-containing protein n=1 Tax=Lutibacter oricola TaxID=762486 RepID=A0A1H3C7Z9_9FLAO|nr:DUF2851 family protein [Lutibacter oricola]SDX50277.1 Protein of unknown function [Lutibacter oricola]
MKENLLHFVWKLKMFTTKKKILSTKGDLIEIISAGTENLNSGPDFFNSKIKIANQLWVGNVEIHVKSSNWYEHNHQEDERYNSIILHVVWEHDVEVFRNTNENIVTLELKNFISPVVLAQYNKLFLQPKKWINCENEIENIDSFVLNHFFEQLYFERLEQKSSLISQKLKNSNYNWETVFFSFLSKAFGLKVNGDSFYNFSNSFDFSLVRKTGSNLFQLEALFFGQAGLLENEYESTYYNSLKSEYNYLKSKFKTTSINKNEIQFFRLRPNNFPTIRLSQLATLYHKHQNLFSKIIEINSLDGFYKLFEVTTTEYWETHYTFETTSKKNVKKITKAFVDLLLINVIIPFKFLYLQQQGKTDYAEIMKLIEAIKPEKNSIISNFDSLKIKSTNAFETQALLQLKNEYCSKLKCLNCAVGKTLLTS